MNIYFFAYSTYIFCTIYQYIQLIYFVYSANCIFNLYMLLYNHQEEHKTEREGNKNG